MTAIIAPSEFSPADCRALYSLFDPSFKRFCEIGSWLGRGSTQVFLDRVTHCDGELWCIDTWNGNEGVAHHAEIAAQIDPFNEFLSNAKNERAHPIRAKSVEAARVIADKSFDLIFIDADHRYGQVRRDIEYWWPKVKQGGILCGHDCELRAGPELMRDLTPCIFEDTIQHSFSKPFPSIHPGVIVAVHERFPDVKLFAEHGTTEGTSSIWWTRKW